MRGSLRHILLATVLLPLFGCTQSVDLSSDPGNRISVIGSPTSTSEGAARLLSASEGAGLPQPDSGVSAPGTLPFVRSKPKAVPPFPLVMNRAVQSYVNDYLAQPEGLKESFRHSQPYMPEMLSLLQREGLPPDLVYLAFAESGFTDRGAGPWQLSKSTARRFGLVIDRWIDERRDPIKSTRAAAEYLATLHDETPDDWPMTLIVWNNGDARLAHYLRLEDAPYERMMAHLPRRTRSLMNRFMAVALIARHAKEYGLESVNYDDVPRYKIIPVPGGTSLRHVAESSKTTLSLLESLNPALLRDRTPPNMTTYPVRVPDGDLQASATLTAF